MWYQAGVCESWKGSKERRKEERTFQARPSVSKETGSKKCESECCQWGFLFYLRPLRGFAFLSLPILRLDTMDAEKCSLCRQRKAIQCLHLNPGVCQDTPLHYFAYWQKFWLSNSAFQVHSTSFFPFSSSIDQWVMERVHQAFICDMLTCFSSSYGIYGWVGVTDQKVSIDWSLINQLSIESDS